MTTGSNDPLRDPRRLAELESYGVLDSPPTADFDRLTRLAARLLHAPVALVSLVTASRQFFKSCPGLPEPWATERETPLSHSFCQHVVKTAEPLVIADARDHPLVRENLAVSEIGVVAYLGIPLITPDGYVLGSFCVIDTKPRTWTPDEIETLRELAASVMTQLKLDYELKTQARLREEMTTQRDSLNVMLSSIGDAVIAADSQGLVTYLNPAAEQLSGWSSTEAVGMH